MRVCLYIFFLIVSNNFYSQCQFESFEDVAKAHINSLKDRNFSNYKKLLDKEILVEAMSNFNKRNNNKLSDKYLSIKDADTLLSIFRQNYNELVQEIFSNNEVVNIEYKDLNVLSTEEIGFGKHFSLNINFYVDSSLMSINFYVTEIRGCYFIIEPFNSYLTPIYLEEDSIGKNENNLEVVGQLVLIKNIKSNGDTIFDYETKIKVILVESFLNGIANKEELTIKNHDTVYYYLPFNTKHLIYYIAEGYNSKIIMVDTHNVPNEAEVYKRGAQFIYTLELFKTSNFKDQEMVMVVANIYYNNLTGFFESSVPKK